MPVPQRYASLALIVVALIAMLALPGCGESSKPGDQASPADTSKATSASIASDPKADPAGMSAGKASIDVSFISPNFFAALVVNPHRITQLPLIAEQMKDEAVGEAMKKIGLVPTEVEQLIVLVPLPEKQEAGESFEETVSFIAHYTHPIDAKTELTAFCKAMRPNQPAVISEKQVQGKTCYETSMPNMLAYSPNANTVILTNEHYVKKMMASGEPKGPLVEKLQKADADNEVIGAFVLDNFPDFEKLLDRAKGGSPPLVKTYLDAAKTLRGGLATLNLKGDSLLHLALDAKSDDAADTIANLFEQGTVMLNGAFATAKMQIPPEQKKLYATVLKLGDELIAAAAAKKEGAQVDFNIKRPGGMDAALPEISQTIKKAVAQAQASATRAQRMNNLKQIILCMLNYADTYNGHFPSAAKMKDGKPLYSWRVLMLPYAEEANIYKQFHLDEPWDSPHNLELAKSTPSIFRTPGRPDDGKTTYMVFTGKGSAFDGGEGITTAQIRDGLSRTISIVEAGPDKAVIWSKPDDLPFDPEKPLATLGQIPPEGFFAAMFDGSVRRLKVDDATLKAMITPAGGEVVPNP